ncbi:SAM-dependent methyltransferase [Streptomyces shenzhenensis]|uniref:SAM-dependent methyltransferase n=1 Tax=Streptomyces shenzhenensis TaxID=943815 RepID=UPI00368A0088
MAVLHFFTDAEQPGEAVAGLNLRFRAAVERFFGGLELVEPGLAQIPFRRPDAPPPAGSDVIGSCGGVARKTPWATIGCRLPGRDWPKLVPS